MRYLIFLSVFLTGCYASHTRAETDAGTAGDAPTCVEQGAFGCLLDRPCFCWEEDHQAHCRTCLDTCEAEANGNTCEHVQIGGVPYP